MSQTSPDDIRQNLAAIQSRLPQGKVGLVAVSKFHPLTAIREAYDAGQRAFGESRVQELSAKVAEAADSMPDIRWHFIGHLQTNKVRQLLKLRPALIESVDSDRLLKAIDEEALKLGIIQKVLLQVHVAAEETKFGYLPSEILDFFRQRRHQSLRATHICGIMGMASNTDDTDRVARDFAQIRALFDLVNAEDDTLCGFSEVSMGMSDDFPLAIEQGSTLVRVGTAIFGQREY